MKTMKIGPKNEREKLIFCTEALRVDVQHTLHSAMREGHVTQRELARRLDVTEARVSQIFASNSNPSLSALARIFYALGHRCFVSARPDETIKPSMPERSWRSALAAAESPYQAPEAKQDCPPEEILAA